MRQRSIAVSIILSLVTCGIYGIYWMIVLNDDINIISGRNGTSGGMVFLLSLVTCGIYALYWEYQMGMAVEAMHTSRGEPNGSAPVVYLVLGIFGFSIVSYALMQNEINRSLPGA